MSGEGIKELRQVLGESQKRIGQMSRELEMLEKMSWVKRDMTKCLLFKGFQDFTENAGGGQLWFSMTVLSVNQAPHPLFEIMSNIVVSKANPWSFLACKLHTAWDRGLDNIPRFLRGFSSKIVVVK